MFQKIIVIGCPGAGKSTFSRRLRDAFGLPLFYLDMLWHKPDRTNYTREEFDAKLRSIIETESWIIDGNYSRTLEMRLEKCDTVFLLDYPTSVCLDGARARVGKKREEMPWIEETFDPEFQQWITDFSQTKLPRIYSLIEQYKEGKSVFIFKSRSEAEEYLLSLEPNV